ncbi:MAG TPA: RNA methyltransferase, partial [Candidatus Kapabacteria bacterium]
LRRETKTFVIEGTHLVERALESAPKLIQKVLHTESFALANTDLFARIKKKKIPTQQLTSAFAERISDTRTPQGIFATVTFEEFGSLYNRDIIIALDHVSDPGNLGTIIRTAAWFGIEEVVLSSGCADSYSPKVLRSTQGEIFSVKIIHAESLPEVLEASKKKGYKVLATTLSPSAGSMYREKFDSKCIVVFGSEAHGVSSETLAAVDREIIIPSTGAGESLNVAVSAGIVLSELVRQRSLK